MMAALSRWVLQPALVLVALGWVASIHPAQAAEVLTLEEAVQEGLAREPRLQQAQLELEQTLVGLAGAQAERLQYGGDVSVGNWAGLTGLMSSNPVQPLNVPIANAQLMARWPLFTGFRLTRQIDSAEAAVTAARARADEARQDTVFSVLEAFWGIRRAELKLEVQREAQRRAQEALQIARGVAKTGRIPAWEAERAEVSALTAEGEALRMEAEVARSRDQLGALLRRDLGTVPLDASRPLALETPGTAAVRSLERRPDIRLARAELAMRNAGIGVAAAERWPKLEFASLYQYGNNPFFATSGNRSVLEQLVGTFNAQLNLTYNLFDNGLIARNIQARKLEYSQSEQALAAVMAKAEVEVRAARRRLELAERRSALGARNETLARRNLDWLQTRYRFGYVRLTELNETRVNFVDSRNQRLDAEIDRHVALAALHRALGTLDVPLRAAGGSP